MKKIIHQFTMTDIIFFVNALTREFLRSGKSRSEKAESCDRIVRTAAAKFREHGVDRIGVADLMREADLTHGGFYRHFASRDDLVDETIERALSEGGKALESAMGRPIDRQVPLGVLIDGYLNSQRRDDLASSCAERLWRRMSHTAAKGRAKPIPGEAIVTKVADIVKSCPRVITQIYSAKIVESKEGRLAHITLPKN
jgi:AcrR family transcriptional regulator